MQKVNLRLGRPPSSAEPGDVLVFPVVHYDDDPLLHINVTITQEFIDWAAEQKDQG